MAASLKFTLHSYGQHELQRLATWEPEGRESQLAYWIIFIHGGAWRDPTNTYKDFIPSIDKMLASDAVPRTAVRGFASIDYRLSSSGADVPDPVRHPDHIRDVRCALHFLQQKYNINDRYILMGHSVGATLTFQLLMGSQAAGEPTQQVPLPTAAVGIAGIYEFYEFSHRHGPFYINFVTEALGPDQSRWNDVAPLCFSGSYKADWPEGRLALLGYSPLDSLVDGAVETKNMAECLGRHGVPTELRLMSGEHDFAWRDGEDIAGLVAKVLSQLSDSTK